MKKVTLILLVQIVLSINMYSQIKINRVEPPNWWVGMSDPNLQIMVYGDNISDFDISIKETGITIKNVQKTENSNYLFINLIIDKDTKPGKFNLEFNKNGKIVSEYPYDLYARRIGSSERIGFNNSDIIYLIMPDRFSNGNTKNDFIQSMTEKPDRANPDGRHGGDIEGINNHIDYISELGATAIWLNPIFENNQDKYSYHGYSITDFYNTDPRLGEISDYINLVDNCHKKDMKVIMDMIFNHCGNNHWWIKDLPSNDWIHQFPEYTSSNYRASVVVDPYVSNFDKTKMQNGWFDTTMPDLNQQNPLLANYLIQNSIWWIETTNIDGVRMDTQPYPEKTMMAEWSQRIHNEYPEFTILGEVWVGDQGIVSYWFNNWSDKNYKSGLNSIFDFPLYDAMKKGFNEPDGWSEGIMRIYDALTKDYLYKDPSQITIFADNHDVERFYSMVGEDYNKFKTVFTFLMTTRGIPLIYYGTEILMTGHEQNGHWDLRKDLPGGWQNDNNSVFTEDGLSKQEKEALRFVKHIMNWRKTNNVIHSGKLVHFIPEEGIYVYFRYNDKNTIMTILNNRESEITINTSRYKEFIKTHKTATNILTGEEFNNIKEIKISPKEPIVLELK